MNRSTLSPPVARWRIFSHVSAFFASLAGRLAMVLAIGMAASAMAAMFVSIKLREHHFHEYQIDQSLLSAADIAERWERDPVRTKKVLDAGYVLGAGAASTRWHMTRPNADYSKRLQDRLPAGSQAKVMVIAGPVCFGRFDQQVRAAGMRYVQMPDCWFVTFRDTKGQVRAFTVVQPPARDDHQPVLGFPYLELMVIASVSLGVLAARFATAPLRRMTRAAKAFSLIEDAEPIPEKGPSEVLTALRTFNLMQERVREGLRERTQILASVTHDLQTPLTRLRLRLEQVEDEALRARLIADLAATRELVRDGLDLARSSEAREPWSTVDLDSFLSSLSEDAAEFGHDVKFTAGCGANVRVKPNALQRCVDNLVENAVKYGGGAQVECAIEGRDVVIRVLDRGPGLPEEELARAFDPFWRLGGASSLNTNGTGIGLTIAQAQAGTFGAIVTLENRTGGGMAATVRLPAARG
ncbi:ATP-binding protein [Novosphingobium sp. 9]|uniref:ATP-binding protein n=1 Tax=Novosphingobium sp. 9 TaxID=2025349 RepID=UPI0021B47E48|nr:ATP-binding protein [Novosphingobium sp. 9]